jgi:Asp/Glu/hydantoin racemase
MAAAMSHALLLGDRFGIVCMHELKSARQFEALIRQYGLQDRVIPRDPVRGIDLSTHDAVSKGFDDPAIIVRAVTEKAEELIDDGAEVIIIGNGAYGPFCTAARMSSLRGGEVPVLDPVAIALKTAESIVELGDSIGLPPSSRAGGCAPMTGKNIEKVRQYFNLS